MHNLKQERKYNDNRKKGKICNQLSTEHYIENLTFSNANPTTKAR